MNTITIATGTAVRADSSILQMAMPAKKYSKHDVAAMPAQAACTARFNAMRLNTRNFKFNRDEANER